MDIHYLGKGKVKSHVLQDAELFVQVLRSTGKGGHGQKERMLC